MNVMIKRCKMRKTVRANIRTLGIELFTGTNQRKTRMNKKIFFASNDP